MTHFKVLRALTILTAVAVLVAGSALLARSAWSALTGPVLSTDTMAMEEFGDVQIVHSNRSARGLVILAAGRDDAEARRQDALALAKEGLIAVSFDFERLQAYLANSPAADECHYVSDDLKDLTQAVLRKLELKRYFFPIVAGRGDGAAFAYAALAQAPANTLGGGIGVGFRPMLRTDRTYCFDPSLEAAGNGFFSLRRQPDLQGRWLAIGPESQKAATEAFQGVGKKVDYVSESDEATTRQALVDGALEFGGSGERGHSELPVSIIRPEGATTGLALVISGDGGWRDIDKPIGEWLSQRGVAVVGIDSLRYFWSKKKPEEVAADLALLFDHYGKEFGTDHYAIVGYSFGSDIMPDVWPKLPRIVKDHVSIVSLMALGTNADFEVTVEGFIGTASSESRPLRPLLHNLPLDRTQCIYGKEEAEDGDTSCTAPEIEGAQRIALEGGHHFDGDYSKAAEAIWARFQNKIADP